MSGHQNPALVARLLPHLSLHEQTALWTYKEARYEDIVSRGLSPIPGLKDLLAKCHRKNIATYVVTNSNKKSCLKTMASIGIAQHFSNRVVVAEECNHPKPHPAPYQRALQLAAVDPAEAIAFEDSPSGTTSAKLAGLFTIGIRSTQTDLALRTMGAAFTIPDFCAPELLEALVEMGM